jgi:hypothetical protein
MAASPKKLTAELVSLQTIWTHEDSGQPHNAFNDMICFQDRWYVGLREAQKHHGGLEGMGSMRVISSADGESWTSAGHFVLPAGDLRDAKLSITPDGELMLNSAIQVYHPYPDLHRNYVWFSKDGATWSDPVKIGEPDIWIWSVTWHDGVAYGIGYPNQNSDLQKTRLYKSDDGRKWDVLVSELHEGNESSIAFKADGTALCYLRGGHVIGQSLPLYTNWKWADTRDVGGPKLFGLPDGQYILGGRGGQWGEMKLFEIDPDTGESHELIELPATFDSSYPGIVYHEGLLWVSYYTSSDGATEGGRYRVPTEIRLAKIKLSE